MPAKGLRSRTPSLDDILFDLAMISPVQQLPRIETHAKKRGKVWSDVQLPPLEKNGSVSSQPLKAEDGLVVKGRKQEKRKVNKAGSEKTEVKPATLPPLKTTSSKPPIVATQSTLRSMNADGKGKTMEIAMDVPMVVPATLLQRSQRSKASYGKKQWTTGTKVLPPVESMGSGTSKSEQMVTTEGMHTPPNKVRAVQRPKTAYGKRLKTRMGTIHPKRPTFELSPIPPHSTLSPSSDSELLAAMNQSRAQPPAITDDAMKGKQRQRSDSGKEIEHVLKKSNDFELLNELLLLTDDAADSSKPKVLTSPRKVDRRDKKKKAVRFAEDIKYLDPRGRIGKLPLEPTSSEFPNVFNFPSIQELRASRARKPAQL